MKKFTIALASAAVLAGVGAAYADFTPMLRDRSAVNHAKDGMAKVDLNGPRRAAGPARIATGGGGDAINFTDDFGTLHLLAEEDFSLLTQGTEAEPDMMVDLTVNSMELFGNAWWTFNEEYTHTPHWGCYECYPAGGALYFHNDENVGAAGFATPLYDFTQHGEGFGVIEFKAKSLTPGSTYEAIRVTAAETNGMTATWKFLEDVYVTDIPDTWTTYRILISGCEKTTMFNITGCVPGGFLMDDVKIYELEPFVARPQVIGFTNYKGTSFDLSWTEVKDAEKYLLSVYTYDEEYNKHYLLQEKAVTETTYNVTGAESGEVYYYSVRAVNGDKFSFPSDEGRVYALVAPEFKDVENLDNEAYTASWSAVPGADVYNYWAFDKRVAEQDGEFVVTSEDFTDIRDADGYKTGLTKEEPEFSVYDIFYPKEMKQQGWRLENGYPYDDYVCVDAFHYTVAGENAALISPEMDFSKNGGKITVTVDLAGELCGPYLDENDNEVYVSTQAAVALFVWDDEKGDYVQKDLKYPARAYETDYYPVKDDWKTFTFVLEGGTERSTIGIFGTLTYGNLYIDNVKVTQQYKKDEYLIEPFLYDRFHGRDPKDEATSIDVVIPQHASDKDIYHKVSAYGRLVDERAQAYDDRESPYSETEFVFHSKQISGVSNVQLVEGSWTVEGDKLVIENPAAANVTVCDLNGVTYFEGNNLRKTVTLGKGIYVVKIGNRIAKVIL